MTPDVVVDVGNTRIKFGLCDPDGLPVVSAMPFDLSSFDSLVTQFGLEGCVRWAVAGVHPDRQAQFVEWAVRRGDEVRQIGDYRELPLRVEVDHPEAVGIDRLLGAVAANRRRQTGRPAVVVDAGSAVTVNSVNGEGVFLGGAIMPGLGLMTRALHAFTAKLPLVSPETLLTGVPRLPATNTRFAILCGIHAAAVGGVRELIRKLSPDDECELFVTGGDGAILAEGLATLRPTYVTSLTLEGIRIAAEALP